MTQTSEEQFIADIMQQSYAFHRLVILGEAATHLAKIHQARFP